ncbi:uncharacterized protein RAG0_13438 [Rhynchosporium agropyri]|uniref:Uncharacterized protein n=1 Tax=Rhynchosporium agropyri TaxID=914238 RepID=A0A1E1LCX3_9HELO|nr:uncharacterized protein RAG0_13438 [Rhynchosporium agropyri]
MGRTVSSLLTPSHRPHSRKKQAKETARKLRQAQQKSLSFHSERLCHHADWEYLRTHEALFPIQREAEPAKESILALKNNASYSQSSVIQTYGKANLGNESCTCCAKVFAKSGTRTWKGCVSFPVGLKYPDRVEGAVPFLGQCANCHWGSQGYKCSLRVSGVKVPPRRMEADLYQSRSFTHTHLGSMHNLNTTDGCTIARQELQGIMNQLSRRAKKVQERRNLDHVREEKVRQIIKQKLKDGRSNGGSAKSQPSSPPVLNPSTLKIERLPSPASAPQKVVTKLDDGGDDQDIYDGPESPPPPRASSTSRTRQITKSNPSTPAPTSRRAFKQYLDDQNNEDNNDEEDHSIDSVIPKSTTQALPAHCIRQIPESSLSPSPFQSAVLSYDSDDDDEYIGPANILAIAQATPKRQTRLTSKQSPVTPQSRVEVVLPAFQPSRGRFRSPSFHTQDGWY